MSRISRHELKEDKFVTTMLRSYDYMKDHTNYIIGIVVIIAIIGFGIYGYTSFRNNLKESRVNMLGEAELAMRFGDLQTADSLLQNLVEDHANTLPGQKATYYLANLKLTKFAEFDEAIKLYEQYIQNPIEGEHEMVIAARVGIAAANEEKKEFETAAKEYIEIYEEYPEYFDRARLLLNAGRCYKYDSKFQEAVTVYQRYLDEHEGDMNYDKAQIALARIRAMAM